MDKLKNFRQTLCTLKEFSATPIQTNRDKAGVIQAFEFTFEQAWKAIQKIAADQGVPLGSPKSSFVFAMQNQWIIHTEESQWLQMLMDRNLTAHTYEEDIANEVLGRIISQYIPLFSELLLMLEKASKPQKLP